MSRLRKPSRWRYGPLLATYLAPQRRAVILLAVLLFGGIALELAGPQLIRVFIDAAVAHHGLNQLILVAILFLVVALVTQVVSVVQTFFAERIGWTATNQLRTDLTLHCLLLDRSFHQLHTPGELIERIDGDVTALGNFFSKMVIQLAGDLLLLLGVIILCFTIDWRVGFGIVLFSIVSLVVMYFVRNAGVGRWEVARQASAELFGFIEERLSGTEDVRSLGAAEHVVRQLGMRSRSLFRKRRVAGLIGSSAFNTLLLLLALGTAGSLGLGAWLFQQGAITLGTVFLIYNYTDLLRKPIEDLSRQLQEVQEATASIARIQDLLNITTTLPEGVGAPLPPGALAVAFDDVTFGYADGDGPVLDHVSFALPAGAKLGVIGRTGGGKTTLARLLFRMYDPTGGSVRLNGVDLRTPPLLAVRERIGLVTQDIQLFHASVRDNLALFDTSIPDALILQILDELDLTPWLATLPDGLSTKLSPDGTGLSAGEAQLLAFARVFLQDPDLVILDEASSRLDRATEQVIERAIERLLAGRTGIIIAHRLATLQRVDTILLLDEGQIAEYGPRADLARDPASRYAALLRVGLADVLA